MGDGSPVDPVGASGGAVVFMAPVWSGIGSWGFHGSGAVDWVLRRVPINLICD